MAFGGVRFAFKPRSLRISHPVMAQALPGELDIPMHAGKGLLAEQDRRVAGGGLPSDRHRHIFGMSILHPAAGHCHKEDRPAPYRLSGSACLILAAHRGPT